MDDNSIDLISPTRHGHNNNNGDLISRWEAALYAANTIRTITA